MLDDEESVDSKVLVKINQIQKESLLLQSKENSTDHDKKQYDKVLNDDMCSKPEGQPWLNMQGGRQR